MRYLLIHSSSSLACCSDKTSRTWYFSVFTLDRVDVVEIASVSSLSSDIVPNTVRWDVEDPRLELVDLLIADWPACVFVVRCATAAHHSLLDVARHAAARL